MESVPIPAHIGNTRTSSKHKQVAAVLAAKGRIAAATYRMTLAMPDIPGTMGRELSPSKNCPFP